MSKPQGCQTHIDKLLKSSLNYLEETDQKQSPNYNRVNRYLAFAESALEEQHLGFFREMYREHQKTILSSDNDDWLQKAVLKVSDNFYLDFGQIYRAAKDIQTKARETKDKDAKKLYAPTIIAYRVYWLIKLGLASGSKQDLEKVDNHIHRCAVLLGIEKAPTATGGNMGLSSLLGENSLNTINNLITDFQRTGTIDYQNIGNIIDPQTIGGTINGIFQNQKVKDMASNLLDNFRQSNSLEEFVSRLPPEQEGRGLINEFLPNFSQVFPGRTGSPGSSSGPQ